MLRNPRLKSIVVLLVFMMVLAVSSYCFAADKYYDANWDNNPKAYTIDYGLKAFPHSLTVHEAANLTSSDLVMFYHEVYGHYADECYLPAFTWTVDVAAYYRSGSTEVGSIGWLDWTSIAMILPPGYTGYGGWNSDDFSLSLSSTRSGLYQTTVDSDQLYWPLITDRTLTFN